MKKRILAALTSLFMLASLLPVSAFAAEYGPDDDLTFEMGAEVTLTGTEGTTSGWTYGAKNGYLDDGMVLTTGDDSTNQLTFRFDKAGMYKASHRYRTSDNPYAMVMSDYFEITVQNPNPTVADLEMYTEYTETDALPNDAASATFAYVLTYHGNGGFSGVDPSFGDEGTVAMEATLTAANEKVLLAPVDEADLDLELPQGYYSLRYVNAAGSDAGKEVTREETVYFQVTDFGAINVGTSGLASDGGKSTVNSENVPKYSTITLNSGVFADVATEEPDPEPAPSTKVEVAVGETETLTGAQQTGSETHAWNVDSGFEYITLTVSETEPWTATVTGVDEGEATVSHTYTDGAAFNEYFTVTVTAAEEPEPEPEYAAYIAGATEGENVYFEELQAALNAAEPGDTVVLCKDLADVAVTVEVANLTLDLNGKTISGQKHTASEGGSSTTPRPDSDTPAAITIGSNATGAGEEDQPQVGSFTLKNGTVSVGTGLRLYDDLTALTVENVVFQDNVASNAKQTSGGAAVNWRAATNETVEGTSATFVDCKFLNNSSGYKSGGSPEGGAVALNCVGNVQFTNCAFTGNKSIGTDQSGNPNGVGGAVYLSYCGNTAFDGCTFSENAMDSASGGGAVHTMWCGDIRFTGCTFTGNRSEGGAGGALALTYSVEGAKNVIESCTFTGNTAANGGGALWVSEADVELDENTVMTQNTASAGGAMMLQGNVNAVVNCDLSGNSATKNYGGAAWVYGQAKLTVNGDLTENTASTNGGAVYAQWGYYYDAEGKRQVGIPTVTLNGNATGNKAGSHGGALYGNIANFVVNGTVTGNTAGGLGGGLYNYNGDLEAYPASADLTKAAVYNNTAATAAADLYNNGGRVIISEVPDGLNLTDCGHAITGWYNDAADDRWAEKNADAFDGFENDAETAEITGEASLIAAHAKRSSGGGGGGGGGSSKPALNKEDHIAYVSGYPDGTVQPQDNITREEVAAIFFRLLTDESRADFITEENPYPDVESDRWSFYAIATLTNGELMLGRPDGTFDPSANITRAEFAVVAAQFSNAKYSGADKFSDISGHWAQDYINRAANEGWIAGYPDGTFGPDQYITRAEVMALVNEVLDRAPDAGYMLDDMKTWPDNDDEDAWYYEDVQEATNCHSYTWRNSQHTSEKWEEITDMRSYDDMVRDAFDDAR